MKSLSQPTDFKFCKDWETHSLRVCEVREVLQLDGAEDGDGGEEAADEEHQPRLPRQQPDVPAGPSTATATHSSSQHGLCVLHIATFYLSMSKDVAVTPAECSVRFRYIKDAPTKTQNFICRHSNKLVDISFDRKRPKLLSFAVVAPTNENFGSFGSWCVCTT